jgi:hypothetical protein
MARWSGLPCVGRGRVVLFFTILAFVLLASPLVTQADTVATPAPALGGSAADSRIQADTDWGKMPLYFTANQGQVDGSAAYYVQGKDKTLYFTSEGLTFALTGPDTTVDPAQRWVVKLDYLWGRAVAPRGQGETQATMSYFTGSPDYWHTGVPTYSSLAYPGVWRGIDVVYSGTQDQLKQEFVVAPGADPDLIRLAYRGAAISLNDKGELVVSTPVDSFTDAAPIAYQEVDGKHVSVPVEFALGSASGEGAEAVTDYGFRLGVYDPSLPLVIDPAVLIYCGYLGGSAQERGFGIAVDSQGCAYVTGETNSGQATFPEAVGPDLTFNGLGAPYTTDAFVAKVRADGTGLVYCGYIGGNSYEESWGIAVDSSGNAYVTGDTQSSAATFPATVGPDLTWSGGEPHAFVAKINATGTALVYCGYLHDDRASEGSGIAVDSSGCAYVSGSGFVDKVKADGTGLVYSYPFGGEGIAVDPSGCAYVTGGTMSTEATFPVTVGPDLTFNDGTGAGTRGDAYVAKLNALGTGLVYCGYIGGACGEEGQGIAVDAAGCAYVTGRTASSQASFPVVGGPDLTYNDTSGFAGDAFVAKVKADGTGLVYCGYIGTSSEDDGFGIAVDIAGNAYAAGFIFHGENEPSEAYVAKVKADGTSLAYDYTLGDSFGSAVAVDADGCAYLTGDTGHLPVTVGPDLTYNGGGGDAFVAKIADASRYQDNDSRITYVGLWSKTATWSASGGGYVATSQSGAVAIAKFTGTSVRVVAKKCPWYGQARIQVDGAFEQIVDLYSPNWAQDWKVAVYTKSGLSEGEHILTIECLGTKNGSSLGTSVCLDSLDVDTGGSLLQAPQTTRIQDDNTTYCTYDPGVWKRWDNSGYWAASMDTYAHSDQDGAKVTVAFDGTFLSWVSRTSNTQGKAQVTLDPGTPGEKTQIVDLYSPSAIWKKNVYSTGLLTDGPHTVVIECLREKNWSSWWYTIGVDAFDVMLTPEP